jgi:rhodanese-related sulfurtransferase
MKKLSLILIAFLLVLTSCDGGGDDTPVVQTPAFELMKDYMVNNGYDIPKITKNSDGEKFVAPAPAEADLDAFLAKYHIVDIRNATDYANGHIQGAKNVAFGNILAEGAQGKPVLIVCYSGQTACYATALMRMYGYKHTQALKWGMSGWNSNTAGSWNGRIGSSLADGHANWSYGAAPSNMVFSDPEISTIKTDGSQILKDRVEQVVAAGFGAATASGADVLDTPSNYFINNYFSEADYAGFGHVDGAYRILPLSLAGGEYKNLDPSPGAKVVTYCYTGQTSAVLTACLRVLGYDAYSMTFGMNGIYNTNSAWTTNQWGGDSNPKNLPVVQ